MSEINFEYSVSSDVDFEDLIADIGFDGKLVAILSQEEGFDNMRIQIYSPENAECWNFRLDELENIIKKAKTRLWELRKMPES